MVKYPLCFTCALYDMKTDTCPAFPQGVYDAVLQKKMQEGADIACANNIFYKPIKSDLKDTVKKYDDSPEENEKKLRAEEEKSAKLKDWVLE